MYIVAAILAFGILVVIHEFGHFIMAKANNVKVEEFSIGMGPKIAGVKKGETEYLIKALPIGGYVKMLGDEGKSSDPRAFNNKKPLQKLSIVAAGPIMNFILAIVLFGIVASLRGFYIPVISKLEKNQPAESAGLKVGDKIIKVNQDKIVSWDDFVTSVYNANGKPLNIVYERNGDQKLVNVTPVMDKTQNKYIVGVYPTILEKPTIGQSISYGFIETKTLITQTFGFFKTLVKGKASYNDFGGPITIFKVSSEAAKQGILALTSFGAFISVQLAVFNVIPFPALDGGYILLFLIESITGKKLDENKLGVINYIGFAILMTLMVLVTIKDILYPVNF